jgi:hypothetical protein
MIKVRAEFRTTKTNADPDPHGSELVLVGWIRIRIVWWICIRFRVGKSDLQESEINVLFEVL